MLTSMEPTLQLWRLNQMSRSNEKLGFFGLKPNRCKKKKKDSTTNQKFFTYDKSQKLTKKLTKQRTKYVCNYGFDCNITLCCRQ